ncbi:MAG: ECF transporter S component [Solobacterium sp.]|nr:ECF transporter S component [Solobacterium sp.]
MNRKVKLLSYTVMFAAINFVVFTYAKINIPVGSSTVAIHVANAVVVLSAWLIGPVYGGLAGAVGLSIADVLDPLYIISAPKTFFLKFMIGFIAGTMANKMSLHKTEDPKAITRITAVSAAAGLGFNVIFEPVISYLYRRFLLRTGAEAAAILASWLGGVTAFNAVVCLFVSILLYKALYRSFRSFQASER